MACLPLLQCGEQPGPTGNPLLLDSIGESSAHFLLRKGYSRTLLWYQDGKLAGISLSTQELARVLNDGVAFETSGCSGCNRPYYNERPGGVMFPGRLPRLKAAYSQTKRRQASAACFDAPSHYEITVQGRKLVGSAQVRKDGVILQHGSILLDFNPSLGGRVA